MRPARPAPKEGFIGRLQLLGVDGSRLESVRTTLEKHQTDRSVRYLPVDTGDRQRLVFLQVRAVFPFSDWRAIHE